jgi:hypothetical protein
MFWQAEDIQPAVNVAVKMFGPQGRMDVGKKLIYNASIFTKEFGKLWYGDLNTNGLADKLKTLSAAINMTVYVVDDSFNIHTISD